MFLAVTSTVWEEQQKRVSKILRNSENQRCGTVWGSGHKSCGVEEDNSSQRRVGRSTESGAYRACIDL